MGRTHPGAGLNPVPDGGSNPGPGTTPAGRPAEDASPPAVAGPGVPAGPSTWPPPTRWPEPLHRAVRALADAAQGRTLPLVALSGGADSLALAVAAAEAARTRAAPTLAAGVGAVIVDHGLQPGSDAVARRAATVARALGLDPVTVARVEVPVTGEGPEAEARAARHAGLEAAARRLGSDAVLLAHTRDDQAEQVLLGLARGSGTRSLAGIPRRRGMLLRPLLDLTRQDTESICAWAGVRWWEDPTNADPAYLRSRIRTRVLPVLEDPHHGLGPGLSAALARSADIAAEDAAALEDWAAREFDRLREAGEAPGLRPSSCPAASSSPAAPPASSPAPVSLPLGELAALPEAIRYRVIGYAVLDAGGERPSRERVLAVDRLVATRSTGGSSAGPVELAGGVVSHRRGPGGYARLVFSAVRPFSPSRTGPAEGVFP
ncbi:tRNA lysidine(34) synthetase TilS [Citricoccus sp. NPDC055426]|uniref:tRNA lysidine(34) synthetase TilS n=1 Tax=Citricoccus sp. NPDC055426 TaxID=3155536 RepID=UPI003425CAFB